MSAEYRKLCDLNLLEYQGAVFIKCVPLKRNMNAVNGKQNKAKWFIIF